MAAAVCEAHGAESIVVHLREDRRHIQDRDVRLLRTTIRTRLNLEMSIAEEIVSFACRVKPDQATLVPEKRQELTTEGGLNVIRNAAHLRKAITRLKKSGIDVSLFIDPDTRAIAAAADTGVRMIELHTGAYAAAGTKALRDASIRELEKAVQYARKKHLHVYAGHGLDYANVSRIAEMLGIEELNIGYSIICRAIMVGLPQAVHEMKDLIR
jgi:pyridoxine 5-phosphate synthase